MLRQETMKTPNKNLQTKTKIPQETNSITDSNKYDNSGTMHEENKQIVFGLSEHQAANESHSSDFVDRYQTDKFRVEKIAESLE